MRIDSSFFVNRVQGVKPKNVAQVGETGTAETDSVSFSSRAEDVRVALDALKSAPEVRTDQVQALRQQVQDGSFQVNAQGVAEKLLGGR